ncbi:unnamed protein product [Lota lota]
MVLEHDFAAGAWTQRVPSSYLALLLLLSLHATQVVQSDIEFPRDRHFSWRAGQWGHCTGEECGSGGVQTRTLWCVHTEGWTTHHSHCPQTDKPESRRPCFKVCEWHQDLFEWEVSPWGSCFLVPFFANELRPRPSECVTAQHGIQRRSVRCVRTANRTAVATRICEFFSQRPWAEQACLIPCPQDCVVSDFTPWSGCSGTCGAGLQHRTRHVLATPVFGGAHCPNLTQTRACSNVILCPSGASEHRYSLKVGSWSECRLPHHKDLVSLSGKTTVDYSAAAAAAVEKNLVKRHAQDSTHAHHQHHHHSQNQHGQHHHHHHHHHHHDTQPHPASGRMSWELEVGYQTRQVRCTRSDGKNSMLSLCTHDDSPLTFQSCVMPKDCETSDWSLWSPCSKTCRSADLSPGYRVRARSMAQIPIGGGKECPALKEKEACNIIGDLLPNCPRFVWRTTDWGPCRVSPLLGPQDRRAGNASILCGGGIHTREVYCVQVPDPSAPHHRKEVSRPVSAGLCAGEESPSVVQLCSLPCPQPCLLSPWSAWEACLPDSCLQPQEPQRKKGFRHRRRQVLWEPADVSSQTCPHLLESDPCEDPACYLWRTRPLEECVPSADACGPGTAGQNVTCADTQGKEVPDTQCAGEPPPASLPCEVACPGDCVVGPWSTWSTCSHTCGPRRPDGRQSRTRSVLALPGKGGRGCPGAPALEEWRPCSEHPCTPVYWHARPWGPCVEDSGVNSINGTGFWNGTPDCSAGVQIRAVDCVKAGTGQVVSQRCPDSARPDTLRPCVLPCRRDCVVTPFSEWTACPTQCTQANATAATQSRYRTVIRRAANGGQECPDTLYEERECESLPLCPVYRWKTSKWHSCTLVPDSVRQGMADPGEPCGNGLETRGLSCVSEQGEAAPIAACLRWAGPSPSQVRECRVACRDDCAMTAWSKFSDCAGCGSTRSRRRSLTGRSKKKERCLKEAAFPLVETEDCPCNDFLSQPHGNWSACVLPAPAAPPGALRGWSRYHRRKECGQGLRFKALACVDRRGHLVDPKLCTHSGYETEVCHIPCPLDCKLSAWTAWTACSAPCGGGLKIRSKWLREKAFNGGRPCPKLDMKNQVYEALPCHSECGPYAWRAGPWSMCNINAVDALPSCGEGAQSRKIRCVVWGAGEGGEESSVEDSLCDQEEVPAAARVCVLPCPGDCVVTPWGPWSLCPPSCDQGGANRTRSRRVLRLPASADSVCPEVVQSEPCLLNTTCFLYQYRATDWSTCQLSENAVCGRGFRSRLVDCLRSDGKLFEPSVCQQFGLLNEWKLSEGCEVDCPVSCLLSDWSPWTECSHTCGNEGQTMRSRRVLHPAEEEGRPCPGQLLQTRSCPIRPCYSWLLSPWSQCTVEGADCGEGLRRRSLSCVVQWGAGSSTLSTQPVADHLCGDRVQRHSQQEMELPCFVPCPGDCHLTEWSSWSSCQLTCLEGRSFETTGRQARSRAVIVQVLENQDSCPRQVFQTQPCTGGRCYDFHWRTGGWRDNKREVWCQRSDGLNVTGGCFSQNSPTTVRYCHPPCTKPFSRCTPSGVCGCERGYTEVMTAHGFLDYCTRTPGADHKKADVKTNSGRFRPGPPHTQDFFSEWSLRPVGPDGRLRLWVYGVTAVGFILILFVITVSFLLCKPFKPTKSSSPPQKALTLAYDGDVDM